jgi:hypothetical protein
MMSTVVTTPRQSSTPSLEKRLPGLGTYVVLANWAAAVLALIAAGAYEGGGNPPLVLMATVAGPVAAFAVAFRVSPRFRSYVLTLDPQLVLGAQLWRVVGAAFLFALAFGELDAEFAIPAGVGDILTGMAALAVIVSLINGTLTRGRFYAFTALGVGDFLVAIVTGLTLRPPALDLWPLIIFPTMAVPFFGVLHLIAVLQERNGRLAQ